MGRLEKIVVVVVLFLVAVILGISLGTDGGDGSSPLVGRNRPEDPGVRAKQRPGPESVPGLMSASGTTAQPAGAPAQPLGAATPSDVPPASQPVASDPLGGDVLSVEPPTASPTNLAGSTTATTKAPPAPAPRVESQYLVSREGLEPTPSDELMLYTWKAGDTFKAVSEKYYGSQLHVARLRNANEGRKEGLLAAGDKILVPVVPAAAADRIARAPAKEASATTTWTGGLYTVGSGDVLGTISQKVYGTSKSWRKIYDANRDVIGENPNSLKVGTKLRIPE